MFDGLQPGLALATTTTTPASEFNSLVGSGNSRVGMLIRHLRALYASARPLTSTLKPLSDLLDLVSIQQTHSLVPTDQYRLHRQRRATASDVIPGSIFAVRQIETDSE